MIGFRAIRAADYALVEMLLQAPRALFVVPDLVFLI